MSTASSSNPWVSIDQICIQRARRALYNQPPPRLELEPSPYPQFTRRQLDMRRKCEILQYKANASNTKTNNLTKAQRYSQLVANGSLMVRKCTADLYKPTPTSSSDIPGPVINLQLNPNVPLYNYVVDRDAFGLINSVAPDLWFTTTDNNIENDSRVVTELFALFLNPTISQNYYTYQFQTPVSLQISGGTNSIYQQPSDYSMSLIMLRPDQTNPMSSTNLPIVYVYVYYNSTLVISNDPNVLPVYTSAMSVTFSPNFSDQLDIHVTSYELPFSATQFAGIITVSNMTLLTQPGFIYDIKVAFPLVITPPPPSANTVENLVSSVFTNVTSVGQSYTNCTILSDASTDTNTGFQLISM
jgi:hypothetical protein